MTDQQTLDVGVEPEADPDESPDTSEDYTFTRPQCRALTANGERCSNPVRRGEDTTFCPQHDDTDVRTIDDKTTYPGGDYGETRYLFVESVCENHTAPPGPCPENHLHASAVLIDGEGLEDTLVEQVTSVPCAACDGETEASVVRGTWPPENPTTEGVLELFQQTRGQLVLECYPTDRDRRFYVGEIGGRYDVRDEDYGRPELPTGVDDLPAVIREHPTTLSSVDETPLEGLYEDYCNGVL